MFADSTPGPPGSLVRRAAYSQVCCDGNGSNSGHLKGSGARAGGLVLGKSFFFAGPGHVLDANPCRDGWAGYCDRRCSGKGKRLRCKNLFLTGQPDLLRTGLHKGSGSEGKAAWLALGRTSSSELQKRRRFAGTGSAAVQRGWGDWRQETETVSVLG